MTNTSDLSLRQLRIFDALLSERNLTQVARVLNTTQPSISKTLARLRQCFEDPLFIRVGMQMRPTPKAERLEQTVRTLLAHAEALQFDTEIFEPKSSRREFRLLLSDAGMMYLLPQILRRIEKEATGIKLIALPMDSRHLEDQLESGHADIAVGSFTHASRTLRRQRLYEAFHVCVARRRHPRLALLRARQGFFNERHVLVSASHSGHAVHELVAHALEAQIPKENICLRVPSFAAVAAVVRQTDAIGTLPARFAEIVGESSLVTFSPPFPLPSIEIGQFWHERYQQEPGHKWLRSLMSELFRSKK